MKRWAKRLVPAKYWNTRRKKMILKQHRKVADFWFPIIEAYYHGEIEKYPLKPEKNLGTQKIIWQYWGQGLDGDELPEIIRLCFESVDKYKQDYQVIRLTDTTLSDYLDLPDFVLEKRNNRQFTRTFFSDLLRLALLATYGGVWLDATVLLTGPFPEEYKNADFFMFQRSDEERDKSYWENVYAYYFGWDPAFKVRMLSSVIFAQRGNVVISALYDLLLYFWKTEDSLSDYFCFQILFHELMANRLSDKNCAIVNDCIPHILQTKINGNYDSLSFEETFVLSNIHKMAYFDDEALYRLKVVLGVNRKKA